MGRPIFRRYPLSGRSRRFLDYRSESAWQYPRQYFRPDIALNPHGNIPVNTSDRIILNWNPEEFGNDLYSLRAGTDANGEILIENMSRIKEYAVPASENIQYYTITRKSGSGTMPLSFRLDQNYPNPFNPVTNISFALSKPCVVSLEIINITGQKVASLVDGTMEAGNHTILWDSRDSNGQPLASGIYFYRLKTGDFIDTKKMMLLK
jgi:hypothetical protein